MISLLCHILSCIISIAQINVTLSLTNQLLINNQARVTSIFVLFSTEFNLETQSKFTSPPFRVCLHSVILRHNTIEVQITKKHVLWYSYWQRDTTTTITEIVEYMGKDITTPVNECWLLFETRVASTLSLYLSSRDLTSNFEVHNITVVHGLILQS